MNLKAQLRSKALAERRLLSEEDFEIMNSSLVRQLSQLVADKKPQAIHTFLPIQKNREPDVTSQLSEWWDEGRKIMVSKTNFETKEMSHFWMTESTQLETNSWGIPEPINAQPANFEEVDLLIVPLLVGDEEGNRIGYGGGYYDKLLKEFRGQSVGLSLSPKVDRLEVDPWDISLDVILTA